MGNKKHIQTHAEFFKNRRPEYFSDSIKYFEITLPKEHLAYELSKISTNQKQDSFETLGRRLAEKFISPNLIPQVGPTGGGDGKTDSETYPVSEFISDRWFIPENGWNNNENWAFAISAKADWKSKVKLDVKKIFDTNRGYTKIFFISNQKIRSKDKKDIQDSLREKFQVEIIILDGEWIIEKIYDNNLINLVVDSLNLSDVYKSEKISIGKNDIDRIKRLEEIEIKINSNNRYFEYDYQLIEDALESAILTRMLERPIVEVYGKFDRVLKLSEKLQNKNQIIRIYYQRAWTYINWYDDYPNFFQAYTKFKELAKNELNINNIELYFNLINLLSGTDRIVKNNTEFRFEKEENEFIDLLETCIVNEKKPITSIVANTYKSLLIIVSILRQNSDVSGRFYSLQLYLKAGVQYLEYPFESFKKMIEIFGGIFPDHKEYDDLVDCIAELSKDRASELSSGEVFFKRAPQKLSKGYYKESLIYFGKSVRRLAKKESQDYLYYVLMGLSEAYKNLGLLWASNNCVIAASGIAIQEWYNEGRLNIDFYKSIEEALKVELLIGRIPILLNWFELYRAVSNHFEENPILEGQMRITDLVDACLSIRLLNTSYDTWNIYSSLPELFEENQLWLSKDTLLYMLGHLDLVKKSHLENNSTIRGLDEYYNKVANQPFRDQIAFNTDMLNSERVKYKSTLLGTEIVIDFQKEIELSIFSETLLAFLESFLATSFENVFPLKESVKIYIDSNSSIESYTIDNPDSSDYKLQLNLSHIEKDNIKNMNELLYAICSKIVFDNFTMSEPKEYLSKLFKEDEIQDRQVLIMEHRKFIKNIFGNDYKVFIGSWLEHRIYKEFNFIREKNSLLIDESSYEKYEIKDSIVHGHVRHDKTKIISVIDVSLWDMAHWKGFGYFVMPQAPLCIFLGFEDANFGKKIFQNWIERFGKIDKEEVINISIIKGVDRNNPSWYRVHISKKIDGENLSNDMILFSLSRFHELKPKNSHNLDILIDLYSKVKYFWLYPAFLQKNGSVEPYYELGIYKRELTIKSAWEIGRKDIDSVVMKDSDKPIIPSDKLDAPILEILNRDNME